MTHHEPGLSAQRNRTHTRDLNRRSPRPPRKEQVVFGSHLLHALIELLLTTLPLANLSSRQQKRFWRGIGAASLQRSAVNATSKAYTRGYSGRRLREILATCFTLQRLRTAAPRVLQYGLRPLLAGRRWDVAMDYTTFAYYGKPLRSKKELLRRKSTRGTANHHAYASLHVVYRCFRFTLAVIPFGQGDHLKDIVEALLREAERCGIRIRRVLADREFATVAIMRLLQAHHLPYLMAVKQSGPKHGVKAMVAKHRGRAWHGRFTWTATDRTTKAAGTLYIIRRNAWKGTGRTKTQYFTYVGWGFRMRPSRVKDYYRKRFGIETSYRLVDLVRARTTSRNPAVRYLYVLVAFGVLNQWALTRIATGAKAQRGPTTLEKGVVDLARYVGLVLHALGRALDFIAGIVVIGTLPKWWRKGHVHRREVG